MDLNNWLPDLCISESIEILGLTVKRNTLNKFMDDKAFIETEVAIVIVEGYLLNKTQLFDKYRVSSMYTLVWQMYQQEGDMFFNAFRGGFSGILYDKKKNKWLIYTNHVGDYPVFYAIGGGAFYAGSQVNYVIDACCKQGINLTFNESAAYQMLTFAYMADDSTYAQEIKRLRGGTYLCVENGNIFVKTYHTFSKDNSNCFARRNEKEIIDILDRTFRTVVELEYRKDDEYRYKHLTDLSGGLDSRMNMWVAHSMNPRHMQLMTYCRSNYIDEMIAKEIAAYWKDELLVKSLDDASFLYDIDEIVFMNGGLSIYSGITGGKRMLEEINVHSYGMEHTGMLGDVIIGSWYHHPNDGEHRRPTGRYSEKLSHRLSEKIKNLPDTFSDYEVYLMYPRGFHGMTNTHMIRQNYTEVVSPFINTDFLQLCFDIPVDFRIGHNLYKKWIISKYPQAAKYKWEKTRAKITEPKTVGIIRHLINNGPQKLLRLMGKSKNIAIGMNPIDYWITHDKKLQTYLNEYMQNSFSYISTPISEQLIADMKELFLSGNANEKTMVLTVLGAVKMYFGN